MTDPSCPLCLPAREQVLWRDDFCRVIQVDEPDYPGYCRVIVNAHLRELTDLDRADQYRLWNVVTAVEVTLRDIVRPDKINLASLGNQVPHLHWHVIPRWHDDAHFPDAIWAPRRRERHARVVTGFVGCDLTPLLQRRLQELLQT
ncbi:MAG: HIT family protein [Gammaproteobacteria bacterium]|nr:HIT family protein [Gammaproteobacteria bacterium]